MGVQQSSIIGRAQIHHCVVLERNENIRANEYEEYIRRIHMKYVYERRMCDFYPFFSNTLLRWSSLERVWWPWASWLAPTRNRNGRSCGKPSRWVRSEAARRWLFNHLHHLWTTSFQSSWILILPSLLAFCQTYWGALRLISSLPHNCWIFTCNLFVSLIYIYIFTCI